MPEEIKAIVERFWDEVWNRKNLAIVDELLPDNVVIGDVPYLPVNWR